MNNPVVAAFKAARLGDANALAKLLDQGVLPEAIEDDGDTLLCAAVSRQKAICVKLLLDRGANPNGVGGDAEPLWLACGRRRNAACIREILQHGGDIEGRAWDNDGFGTTPLMHLAGDARSVENLVELLRHSPHLDARNRDDESALSYACAWGILRAASLLLNAGVDPNARVCKGETPLSVACGSHNRTTNAIVKLLIDCGADVNLANSRENELAPQMIPLMTYVRCQAPADENVAAARRIAVLTHNLDFRDADGKSALMLAREQGHWRFVEMLRELGAEEE